MTFKEQYSDQLKKYVELFLKELNSFFNEGNRPMFLPLFAPNHLINDPDVILQLVDNDEIKLRSFIYFNDGKGIGEYGYYLRFDCLLSGGVHIGVELKSDSDTVNFGNRVNSEDSQIKAAAKRMFDYINSSSSKPPASPTSKPGDTASR